MLEDNKEKLRELRKYYSDNTVHNSQSDISWDKLF